MSENANTSCDGVGCTVFINVTAEVACTNHGWMEDEYGNHFCVACQQAAVQMETEKATAEEVESLASGVTEAVNEKVKANRKVQRVRKVKAP